MGIEGKYNSSLKGTNGKITYQKDAYGYRIANTPTYEEKAESGVDIYLTLDSNIQMYLENAMATVEKTEQSGLQSLSPMLRQVLLSVQQLSRHLIQTP